MVDKICVATVWSAWKAKDKKIPDTVQRWDRLVSKAWTIASLRANAPNSKQKMHAKIQDEVGRRQREAKQSAVSRQMADMDGVHMRHIARPQRGRREMLAMYKIWSMLHANQDVIGLRA